MGKQTEMELPPASGKTEGETHDVDYAAMKAGQSAGNRKVISICAVCGLPALAKHNETNLTWLHSETLWNDAKNTTRRKAVKSCKRARFPKERL